MRENSRLSVLFSVFGMVAAGVVAIPLAVPATVNCPSGMARIDDAYCIDRYEASLMEILPSGREQPWSPYHGPERVRVRAASRRHVIPQGYISALQAEQSCRTAGKRLCEPQEWKRACEGSSRTTFPYGNVRQSGRCNENHSRHPVVQLFGHTHRSIWDRVHMNDPQINQLPGTVAPTGTFEGCSNSYGVYDMVGNLHEWVHDDRGTFRGGYYMDTHLNGDGCRYVTRAHDTTYHDYSTGFRCCANLPDES